MRPLHIGHPCAPQTQSQIPVQLINKTLGEKKEGIRLMGKLHLSLLLFFVLCFCPSTQGLPWPFSSSSSATPPNHRAPPKALGGAAAEFSVEVLEEDPKRMKLVENARRKLSGPNTCWQNAYRNLFSSCSEIVADKEKQSRLAWLLSDCFQKDSGRQPFPTCDAAGPMVRCLKKLDELEHKTYLEFFLETNSICHQLQTSAFKYDTERLVNDLTKSARLAEEKLETIEERSEHLLQGSSKIQESLISLDIQTQQATRASRDVAAQINDVLKHSEAIYEQSKGIAASQLELQEGQVGMKEKLESGMTFLQESYGSLGDGLEKLSRETVQIEREIKKVGDSMSSQMHDLQSTANDIGNVAGISLEKQKMVLDGQVRALEGLDTLKVFQSQALEESRDSLQRLAEFGHKQQEELLRRQEQIQQAHDRLIHNSQSILKAQEEFESKQTNIFAALDKLFALHNAILVESRFIKAFFFYSAVIFLLYMLTSAKQTFDIRARLYLGLCITFVVELTFIRLGADDIYQQTWITSKVFLARLTFLIVASIQILHSIFTYQNYEVLNHQLLQTLVEKVHIMEQNSGKKSLSWSTDIDLSMSQYSWIDEELPEEIDSKIDPNYVLPEEVGENSITTSSITRKYDLRPRARR